MRNTLIGDMKAAIQDCLIQYLQTEGIELQVAANDNIAEYGPLVTLETMDDSYLSGIRLLFEIRVILRILGKPWQCDALVQGIYKTLQPHNLSVSELTVLLMSMHIEELPVDEKLELQKSRATLRYLVEA